MSEEETMRLVAEVVDKYSGPIKQMMDQLKQLSKGAKDIHETGKKKTDEHAKAYRDLRDQLMRVKETTTDVLSPAFSALGVTVLSVSGSIAAISESIKKFGEYGEKLEFAHRASGLLTNTIRGLAEENQRFGVSAEETVKSLETFGGHMDELGRRSPTYMNEWKKFGKVWNELGQELTFGGLSREQQLKRAMEYVPTIRNVDQRKRVLALLGLPENWAYLTTKEMREMEKRGEEFNKSFPFNAEVAKQAKESWDELLSTMRGVRDVLSGEFGGGFAEGLHSINDFVKDELVPAIKREVSDIKNMVEDLRGLWKLIKEGPGDKSSWWNRPLMGGTKDDLIPTPGDAKKSMQDVFGAFTDKKVQENVKEGTRKGLEEFYNSLKSANGTYVPMAYHPSDSVGGGSGTPKFGNKDFPNLGDSVDSIRRNMKGVGLPPSGSGPAPSGLTGNKRETARVMADEFKRAGMSDNAIAGIMANVQDESRFNPTLRHPDQPRWGGEAHYAHGLYQEGGAEWNRYAAWLGKNYPGSDWRDPRLQTRFMAENLKQNYPKTWEKLQHQNRFQAGATFVDEYLKPAAAYRSARMRKYLQGGVGTLEDYVGHAEAHGARLRDFVNRGKRSPSDAELLRRGMKATDAGSLDGNAKLTIDLNGFPRGTRTTQKADGIFKDVTLNRGRPMVTASEIS